jgi:hypothetical protein
MGIKGIMRDAPSHRQTLKSNEAPDGTKRYGFWASELKEERKTFGKFAFLVSFLVLNLGHTWTHIQGEEGTYADMAVDLLLDHTFHDIASFRILRVVL